MAKIAYLSLGSNIGDREAALEGACRLLEDRDLTILRRSSVYETEPREFLEQPWFLNLVLEIETRLFPRQLLARIQGVERALGRKRLIAKGPRTIDIDLLLYGWWIIQTPDLCVPHPAMCERRFVLEPLAELVPDLKHPLNHRTVRDLLKDVQDQQILRRAAE